MGCVHGRLAFWWGCKMGIGIGIGIEIIKVL